MSNDTTLPGGLIDRVVETVKKGVTFLSTEGLWLLHGMPFREVMDVNHLYYAICSKCGYFENDGCKICGCRLVPNERSPLNKLSMATTNCPLPEPKWISEITPPDDISPEVAQTALNHSKARLVETYEPDGMTTADQPLMTVAEIKKKQAAAAAANPFRRTPSGQFVQGDTE